MTRRQLFAALASLPFVGRFVKKPAREPLAFAELGGPAQTFTTPWLRTDTYHHAAGKLVTVHFVKDRETGRWFEFARADHRL